MTMGMLLPDPALPKLSPFISEKGIRLVTEGRVRFVQTFGPSTALFRVLGDSFVIHHVVLHVDSEGRVCPTCSCPYNNDWCSHAYGALYLASKTEDWDANLWWARVSQ